MNLSQTSQLPQLKDQTLVLVDASAYLYRAFAVMSHLRSPQGAPTGAIYGITTMLRRLRKDLVKDNPTRILYGACIFDAKGKTFRHQQYPEYKAHRPKMPEELVVQIDAVHQSVRALGWPLLMIDGVEADDVIATLAQQGAALGMQVIISSADKDLTQLVNSHIVCCDSMRGTYLDEAGVFEKFKVTPAQMVDYLCLLGDSSDNIPGVPKVGKSTAAKWLNQYGSLDNLIAHAAHITGVVGDNLRAAQNQLTRNRQLVCLKTDCDLSAQIDSLTELRVTQENTEQLSKIFHQFGFQSLLNTLTVAHRNTEQPNMRARKNDKEGKACDLAEKEQKLIKKLEDQAQHTVTITTWEQFELWLEKIKAAPLTAFDTETTSLNALSAELVGIAFAVKSGEAAYLPLAHKAPAASLDAEHQLIQMIQPPQLPLNEVLAKLKPWLESEQYPKVGHHLNFDQHVLENYGIAVRGIAHDTLLQSYVLQAQQKHNLDDLARNYLNMQTITYEALCGKGAAQIGFNQVPIAQAAVYASEDADITLQLHHCLYPQIQAHQTLLQVYQQIELPTAQVLHQMERHGVLLDCALLEQQSLSIGMQLEVLQKEVYQLAGAPFNLNSPAQIAAIFYEKLGLPVLKKTPGGAPSTDERVLKKLALNYPLPRLLLQHRTLSKLKSTYTDKLPQWVNPNTQRIHTHYAQTVVVTGRLASNNPNLQNIPIRTEEGRQVRRAFIAAPGYKMVCADYSQIELRIIAHLSEDKGLLQAFAQQQDIHQITASEIFGVALNEVTAQQRRSAKAINFGLIYGMSAFGLSENLGISRAAAAQYLETYFQRYPGVLRYMERVRSEVQKKTYVETLFGRRIYFPEVTARSRFSQALERAAINAPVQGTAADLIKLAMIQLDHWIMQESALGIRLIMQVHDELVLEVPVEQVPEVVKKIPEIMCDVANLKAPLQVAVGVGDNWDEAH